MTYRTQDPAALQARIVELEAENARIRRGKLRPVDGLIYAAIFGLSLALPAMTASAIHAHIEGDDECAYKCATMGGVCIAIAPSGFVCRKGVERYAVPRSGR